MSIFIEDLVAYLRDNYRPEHVVEAAALLLPSAARDVLAERRRQVEVEHYRLEDDDEWEGGELAIAGACYAANAGNHVWVGGWPGEVWPWSREWWKPTTPRRDLVKAAALILAEIERLDRAAGLCIDEGCPHAGTAHVCVGDHHDPSHGQDGGES